MQFPIDLFEDLIAVQPEDINERGTVRLPNWMTTLHGKVIARGPDAVETPPGTKVIFKANAGMDSVVNGTPIRIMRANKNVEAILE